MGCHDRGLELHREEPLSSKPGGRGGYRLALAVFVASCAAAELGSRLGSRPFWRSHGRAEMSSAAALRDFSASCGADPSATLILGDSVLYGSALLERHIPAWRDQCVVPALRKLAKRPWIEISSDGMLVPDLRSAWSTVSPKAYGRVVVELNYRMLSAEAGSPAGAFSRPFLDPHAKPDLEERLSGLSAFYRYAQLARYLFWRPSREERLEQALKASRALVERPVDPDLRLNLLMMKIRPYYAAPTARPDHAAIVALKAWIGEMSSEGVQALFFLTPQNGDLIADERDEAAWKANRQALRGLPWPKNIRYADWADWKPSQGQFLDHCHFDAEGNRELAQKIWGALP